MILYDRDIENIVAEMLGEDSLREYQRSSDKVAWLRDKSETLHDSEILGSFRLSYDHEPEVIDVRKTQDERKRYYGEQFFWVLNQWWTLPAFVVFVIIPMWFNAIVTVLSWMK